MSIAYTVGKFMGSSIKKFLDFKHPIRRIIGFFFIFMAVNQVTIFDDEAHDFFQMVILFGGLALIYGSIGFRLFLIGRGSMKILGQLSK